MFMLSKNLSAFLSIFSARKDAHFVLQVIGLFVHDPSQTAGSLKMAEPVHVAIPEEDEYRRPARQFCPGKFYFRIEVRVVE